MKNALRLILFPLFAVSFLCAQSQVIPQVADGAGWQSTLVVTNTTTSNTDVSIFFYADRDASDAPGATLPWDPPFLEGSAADLAVPAGSSVFLHTPGTALTLTQGWGVLTERPGVVAYVIYTYKQNSSATAPAVASSSRVLVPFDNTGSDSTALAIVNSNSTSETVNVTFHTTVDGAITQGASFTLPFNGQMAFVLPTQFPEVADKSGLAEFYTDNGALAIIALQANPVSFTSAPVYPETGTPIIPSSAAPVSSSATR